MNGCRDSAMTWVLALLLILSLVANGLLLLACFTERGAQGGDSRVEELEARNQELSAALEAQNLTIRNYESQLAFYREAIAELRAQVSTHSQGLRGYARLQGPAVLQKTEIIKEGPFYTTRTTTEGAMLNISVEIREGEGRVLVHTTPLMGMVFQDAANTAVHLAENVTGKSLYGSDVIFSVEAMGEVPAVDGPSAGALMTALTIAAIENRTPREDVTLTGTIDAGGRVGAIGGVVEKAQAAKESGKSRILLPRENARLIEYQERVTQRGGFTFVQRVPMVVDAEEYIEREIGIDVVYVETIQDVMRQLGIA